MATKTNLISAINAQLTAIITQAKVRIASLQIVNELYPNVINDTQTSEIYTTKAGTNILYNITIIKQGNVAHIKLVITNATSNIISSQNIFLWKNSEFKPKSGINNYFSNYESSVKLFLSNNVVSLIGSMPAGAVYESEFKMYITND